MRVLFDNGDLHALVPAGRFTIKADGKVEWHTPYSALVTHAGASDDEVFLPGFDTGDAADAVAFLGGENLDEPLVALVYEDAVEPRLDILERATRKLRLSVPLDERRAEAHRLPGLSAMEDWSDSQVFAGTGKRGLRLSAFQGGVFVTANVSGHVLRFVYGKSPDAYLLRVPGGPQNTVFATMDRARGLTTCLLGRNRDGRHSELTAIEVEDFEPRLVGRWPAPDDSADEPVRWGMPTPAILGDYVVTYSDEGPFRKQLALLEFPSLQEIDHVRVPEWPSDLATDGKRFAAVSHGYLVIGHVDDHALVIDQELTIAEIRQRAGVPPTPRAPAATNDGFGTRIWLKEPIHKLVVDRKQPIVLGPRGGVHALSGGELAPIFEPFLEPGADSSARDRFFGPTRGLFDAAKGRLVISRGDELALVDLTTKEDILAVPAEGLGLNGYVFRDGMIYIVEERKDFGEEYVVRFVAPGNEPRILGRCNRPTGLRELPFSRGADEAAWFELSEVDGQLAFHAARFDGAEVTRTLLGAMCKAFALHGSIVFTLRDDQLFEDEVRITREPLPFAVRSLVVTEGSAFFIEPLSLGGGKTHPSQLWRIDLETGAPSIISTATVGAISSLTIVGDTLWWLEARDAAMAVFKLGEDEHLSAVCSLRLGR